MAAILQFSAFAYCGETRTYFYRKHSESSYRHAWCKSHGGIEEFTNKDKTRVDCLTAFNAVEFDFSYNREEAVGQALHYGLMTGKKGKVVLISENPKVEGIYFERVKKLGKIYNFDAEYVTPEILDVKDGKCPFPDCKCKRRYLK